MMLRAGFGIADFLDRDQRLVHEIVVFRPERFHQGIERGVAAQDTEGAAGIGPRIERTPLRASWPSAAMTSGRTVTKASITWSLVSPNFALMEAPARTSDEPIPCLT